jgi:hypothetical protein
MGMASFDPLMTALKIAIPYWIAAILVLSIGTSLVSSKGRLSWNAITEIFSNFVFMFVAVFIILSTYTQVHYHPYAFGQLLASSAVVALLMSGGFLVYARSRESFGAGMGSVALIVFSAIFSITIAMIVFVLPRIFISL